MSRKWGCRMIFLIILCVFNLVIIVILSVVKKESLNWKISERIFGYKLDKPFLMNNTDKRIEDIKFNLYHSVYTNENISVEEENNE